jgi:hypothetical protein
LSNKTEQNYDFDPFFIQDPRQSLVKFHPKLNLTTRQNHFQIRFLGQKNLQKPLLGGFPKKLDYQNSEYAKDIKLAQMTPSAKFQLSRSYGQGFRPFFRGDP